jgi:hypothetical protein
MRGAIPPLPEYAFMTWCSVKKQHRNNFNFTFKFSYNYIHYCDIFNYTVLFFTLNIRISHGNKIRRNLFLRVFYRFVYDILKRSSRRLIQFGPHIQKIWEPLV